MHASSLTFSRTHKPLSCFSSPLAEILITEPLQSTFHSVEKRVHHFRALSVDLLVASLSLTGDRERVLFDWLAWWRERPVDANSLVDESWGLEDCEWERGRSRLCLVSFLQPCSLSSWRWREPRSPFSLPSSATLAVAEWLPDRRSAAHGRRVFSRKRLLGLRRGHFILQPWIHFNFVFSKTTAEKVRC